MKISIITINFNNAAGLKETLDSIAQQTCQEFEHVIVDGGSSDGSVPVIKSYEEQIVANRTNNATVYPMLSWVSEKDEGIYDAMNKGINKASGEYLYFLNSGDTFVDKDVLGRLHKELGKEDIVVSKINYTDNSGVYHESHQPKMDKLSLFYYLEKGIPHQAAAIRKSLFDQYGLYDTSFRISGDWDFFLRVVVLHSATVGYTDITLANFDGNGISSTHGREMKNEINRSIFNALPERVVEDYRWMLASGADLRRLEWIQNHPFAHRLMNTLVGIGRKISK